MYAVNRQKKTRPKGDILWRNPTTHELRIRFMTNGGDWDEKTVLPGGQVRFPAAWGEKTTKRLCKFLVTEEAYQQDLVDRAANAEAVEAMRSEQPAEPAPPSEPTEPLGDASQPRVVTNDAGAEEDSERTSGDALEQYAQKMASQYSYEQLQQTAKDAGVSPSGKKIDVARRIATKAAE